MIGARLMAAAAWLQAQGIGVYVPPIHYEVNFIMDDTYVPPIHTAVNFTMESEVD